MRNLLVSMPLIALVSLMGLSAAQEQETVDNVLIVTQTDAFTDEEVAFFFIHPQNQSIPSLSSLGRRYVKVECSSGSMNGLIFSFSQYLNNGDFGRFEYRIDQGEPVSTQAFQSDTSVVFFHSPGEGLSDQAPLIRRLLAGSNVAVRATSYDGDTEQAQYNLLRLRRVIEREGCRF